MGTLRLPGIREFPYLDTVSKVSILNERPKSPTVSLFGDSPREESELSPVKVDNTPVEQRPLAEGQSAFDWDVGGVKTWKEDFSEPDRAHFNAIAKVAQYLVDLNQYPQEVPEAG